MRNDTGGNADGRRDIGQIEAESFDQRLLAAVSGQEPAIGREGIEGAEEA